MWEYFEQLHAGRSSNGYSANPISYLEIKAWSDLTGIRLSSFDLRAIRSMDNTFLVYAAEKQQEAQKPEKQELPQLTPGTLNALYGRAK